MNEQPAILHGAARCASRRPPLADLEAVEATIWSLLEPYRGELEDATIYGLPSLRWPGAKAHDYFASVKRGQSFVSLYLLVADTYPEALEGTIRYVASETNVPIHVTENGIGSTDDGQRVEYVRRALLGVARCLADGLDVRSYFYWSLLDNFEWLFGYGPRFGLVEVDRATQRRTVKPSGRWLGGVARTGLLDD